MHSIDDLVYLMQRLRDPDTGCPWDLKQNYESIVPHTLEEAYEVADAIERGDKQDLKDELGDLLFQVIFYAQLGAEEQAFTFDDVVDNVVNKLVRRHPHVFPEGSLRSQVSTDQRLSEKEIKANWERIKEQERAAKSHVRSTESSVKTPKKIERVDGVNKAESIDSVLNSVPNNFPSLPRAEKLQKRASQQGFDWDDIAQVFDKIEEELDELKEVLALKSKTNSSSDQEANIQSKLEHEMGDVLFACVNLARFVKVNSDKALRGTNQRFVSRFQYVEQAAFMQGSSLSEMTLEEMDALWDEAKRHEKLNSE